MSCPRCATRVSPGELFCGRCGNDLVAPAGRRETRRRRSGVVRDIGLGLAAGLFATVLAGVVMLVASGGRQGGGAAGTAPAAIDSAAIDPLSTLRLPPERRQPAETQEATVGPAGGRIALADGSAIVVPPGTLATDRTVRVERFEPGLETLHFSVGSSAIFRVTLGDDQFHAANPPVLLTIPWASDRTVVGSFEGGAWVPVPTPAGATVTVVLDHFSTRTLLAIGASLSSGLRTTGEALAGGFPRWDIGTAIRDKEAAHRQRIRGRAEATRQFYGVDETTKKEHGAICEEFKTVILANRDRLTFAAPEGNPGMYGLTQHLADAGKPSAGDSTAAWFWQATAASHETIRQKIVAAGLGHPISPAAVLRIAIDANGGNVPLGVMAAHNVLKNVAYEGRALADPNETYNGGIQDVAARDGQLAASIETWRRDASFSPSGRYDKMGPLYHIFAAMAARLWGGAAYGETVVSAEAVLRGLGWGADIPDPEKGAADECGLKTGAWLATLVDELVLSFEPVTEGAKPGKALPVTLNVKNVPADGVSIELRVAAGRAALSHSALSVSKGRPTAACDVTGASAVCGISVTPNETGAITVEARSGKVTASVTFGGQVCVEGKPSPVPLTGGIKRIEASSFSVCFPESGGEVQGQLQYDLYTEDSVRFGNGPLEITCTYRMRLEYTLTGSYKAPALSGPIAARITIDTSTLAGRDCEPHRKTPSWGGDLPGTWSGSFEGGRLRVSFDAGGPSPVTIEGTRK